MDVQNVTSPFATVLLYNNIPKTGSTSMGQLVERMASNNNFNKVLNRTIYPRKRPTNEQVNIVKKLMEYKKRPYHFWSCHTYFFDEVRNYSGNVAWMNIVRDPVDRFISNFYFDRIKTSDHWFTK
ncbi:hypothetical protein SK128_015872, partial [Halocaridina rubra]